MRFKGGDKIICIRDRDNNNYYTTSRKYYTTTRYCIYEVVEIPNKSYNNIGIINDYGSYCIPNWDDYITLREYRKLKLEKINKSVF